MDRQPEDIPLCANTIKVGIIYNLKKGIAVKNEDDEAEYDNIDTVLNLQSAFIKNGYKVELLEADYNLPKKLENTDIDIAFNIAEGFSGRGREAQVPSLLNMYNIPFTGSDETTLAVALDKGMTKRLLTTYGVKTPGYIIINSLDELKTKFNLTFPVIVKPNAEGSSKGITSFCVAKDLVQLYSMLENDLEKYEEPMLVEEYITGREFTVGLLGNGENVKVFPPMEIIYKKKTNEFNIYSYEVKKDYLNCIAYESPAKMTLEQNLVMTKYAKLVFEGLGCKDFSRIDFMMNNLGEVYFIECNPLPGLAKGYSDLPHLAELNGVDFDTLVCAVLKNGIERNFK